VKNKIVLILAAAAAAVLVSPPASAQAYAGFGAGMSKLDVDCAGLTACDTNSTGYKLYGGYRFQNNLAVEGVYVDWGKAKGTGSISINDPAFGSLTGTGQGDVKATGFGLGVAYLLPFVTADWSGVARLGVMQNRATVSLSGTGVNGSHQSVSFSGSEGYSGTFGYFGLGIGYSVTPKLIIIGEWDISRIKYLESEKANVQLLSLGLRYMF